MGGNCWGGLRTERGKTEKRTRTKKRHKRKFNALIFYERRKNQKLSAEILQRREK
jgi:hypothetical protein